jgi:hypothetical protein
MRATGTKNASISCGAYVAAGVWKIFKYRNLGANKRADPLRQKSDREFEKFDVHYFFEGMVTEN